VTPARRGGDQLLVAEDRERPLSRPEAEAVLLGQGLGAGDAAAQLPAGDRIAQNPGQPSMHRLKRITLATQITDAAELLRKA
jgi:hypothetical protein